MATSTAVEMCIRDRSKIGFGTAETQFFVYGETTRNETFISELRKFVKNLKIVFDNIPNKNFILN